MSVYQKCFMRHGVTFEDSSCTVPGGSYVLLHPVTIVQAEHQLCPPLMSPFPVLAEGTS